jgi:3-oxoadipate enol-lactonase
MPYLSAPEASLYYEAAGSPDAPALVLSNSLGTTLAMWDSQMEAFATRFFVVRYDARGHGRSTTPAGPYSIPQMGSDVLRLLDELALARAHFCGLSLGGMVGQWLAIHASERIDYLILSNTAAKIGTLEGWNQRIQTVQQHGMDAIVPAVLDRWYTAPFRVNHAAQVHATAAMLLACDAQGYVASCAAVRDMDQRDGQREIRARTLVIAGKYDTVTPPEESVALAEAIGGSRLLMLDAAHLANVEATFAFNESVLQFLQAKGGADA